MVGGSGSTRPSWPGHHVGPIRLTKAFPVAVICPKLHKIVPSHKGTLPVTQICPNLNKIVSSSIRAFPVVTEICPNLQKNCFQPH